MMNSMKATRPPAFFGEGSASMMKDKIAAITGEKKRMPNSLSPQRWVPKNCV